MKFLNFFSLVLLFVWQVSAGKCTGGRRNAKRFSSEGDELPYHRTAINNIPRNPPEQTRITSSTDVDNVPPPSYASYMRNQTNSCTPAGGNGVPPPSYNSCVENSSNIPNQPSDIHPIEGHNVTYYSYDDKTRTFTMDGVNRSTGTSIPLDNIQSNFSESSVEAITLKNLLIGYATFKNIAAFYHRYQNTFNTLIIDSCQFSSIEFIEFIQQFLPIVKKLKIINCIYIKTFDSFLNYFKDTLEELVIEECHFSSKFNISSNLNLKNIKCARIIRCILYHSTLNNILTLFPSSLETLEFSHLGEYSKYNGPFFSKCYLTLNFSNLNVNRFTDLKNLAVKQNDIIDYELKFKNLKEFESNCILNWSFTRVLYLEFKTSKYLENLERIKIKECRSMLDFSTFTTFVSHKMIVDSNDPICIDHKNLRSISSILSTFTNVDFKLSDFTDNDISTIRGEDASNFKDLKDVTFSIKRADTNSIALMNCILTQGYGIRTITIYLALEKGTTAKQITNSFSDITYDKIENVKFRISLLESGFHPALATYEFIIQILKRVPNLKYLSFECMIECINTKLFNQLKNYNFKFPKPKKITINYHGSIDLVLWFIKNFNIKELDIENSKLHCDSSELLDYFSNTTLEKLRIEKTTIADSDLLNTCFSHMENLKELHLSSDSNLIALFKKNSTIKMVGIECYFPDDADVDDAYFENIFTILKTFRCLDCISITLNRDVRDWIIIAFKKHLEGREVELTFRIGVPVKDKIQLPTT